MSKMRREAIEQILYFFIVQGIVSLLVGFAFAWVAMIGMGNLHSWYASVPPMGYWDAYWPSVVVLMLLSSRPARFLK